MSRFRIWVGKEFREQRWPFRSVLLVVAIVTSFPFLIIPERTTLHMLDLLPGIATAIVTLVLGLDLFARETRRGTLAMIQRTPGALQVAFPAKLIVFLVQLALALALEEALRHGELCHDHGVQPESQQAR